MQMMRPPRTFVRGGLFCVTSLFCSLHKNDKVPITHIFAALSFFMPVFLAPPPLFYSLSLTTLYRCFYVLNFLPFSPFPLYAPHHILIDYYLLYDIFYILSIL